MRLDVIQGVQEGWFESEGPSLSELDMNSERK